MIVRNRVDGKEGVGYVIDENIHDGTINVCLETQNCSDTICVPKPKYNSDDGT